MLQARNQSGAHAPVWQGEERAEKEGPNMWHEDVSLAFKFHRITGSSNRFLPTLNTSTSSTSNVSPIDACYYEESSVLGGCNFGGRAFIKHRISSDKKNFWPPRKFPNPRVLPNVGNIYRLWGPM